MADLETHNPEFELEVALEQGTETIKVSPAETSDGVEYYKCNLGDQEITQIRQGDEGKWEQLWGDLSESDIQALGKQILDYQ